MDTKDRYFTRVKVKLIPVMHDDKIPQITVAFCGQCQHVFLKEKMILEFTDYLPSGMHELQINFHNKGINDTIGEKDLAVIVDSIEINEFSDPKILWEGRYWPEYPDYYIKEHQEQGIQLEHCLKYSNYLGWNGKWILKIETPVYTWIHKLLSFGTIYPI